MVKVRGDNASQSKRDGLKGMFQLPHWALPDAIARGAPDQQHVRMFAVSHMCGPFIGLSLSAFLLLLGFPPDDRLFVFSALVCLFWAYPAALALGARYRPLSLLSLQHLLLVILWASHSYGGLTSPFLLWLAVVPLLASLYTAPGLRLWLALLTAMAIETGLFAALQWVAAAPPASEAEAQRWLALLSLLSASAYVAMMAVYFGRVLTSRNEMAAEVARRRTAAVELDRRATALRQLRSARITSLSRLERQCRRPVNEMLASGEGGAADRARGSDMACIEKAARNLDDLLGDIGKFRAALLQSVPAETAPGVRRER